MIEKGEILYKEPLKQKKWQDYISSYIAIGLGLALGAFSLSAFINKPLPFDDFVSLIIAMLLGFLTLPLVSIYIVSDMLISPIILYENGVQIPTLKQKRDNSFIPLKNIKKISPLCSKMLNENGFIIETEKGKTYKVYVRDRKEQIRKNEAAKILNVIKEHWRDLYKE